MAEGNTKLKANLVNEVSNHKTLIVFPIINSYRIHF